MPRDPSPNRTASLSRTIPSQSPLYDLMLGTAGLLAFWPLDDAAGSTTVRDASGNARVGSYEGGVSPGAAGIDGRSATAFDGTGRIIIPYSSVFTPATAMSFECWFATGALQLDNFTNGNRIPLLCQETNYGIFWQMVPLAPFDNTATYYPGVLAQFTDAVQAWGFSTGDDALLRQWHHLVGVWDPSNDRHYLYIDGTQATTA